MLLKGSRSGRRAHQPSTIYHSERLQMRDHLPSLSQQKLRSKTPIPSYMKKKTSLSLSNFSLTGLLTADGKH